jgi:hypothetical protein
VAERAVWRWNRRIHFLLGLYLLLFIWLFAISGLVLNHGKWAFADFWPKRVETSRSAVVHVSADSSDESIARALMHQLGLSGEVNRTERRAENEFGLQLTRPGLTTDIDVVFAEERATIKDTRLNAWGVLSALHHFTGVSMGEPSRTRDWWLTRVWSLCIDAIALGLVVLVVTGVYLWWRLGKKRPPGAAMILTGTLVCAAFLYGQSLRI